MRPVLFFAILVLALAFTTRASAHCRKTTAGGDEAFDAALAGECAGGPGALPLYWMESCIAVHVVVDRELEKSGKMTLARASDIVHRATRDWADVKCEGSSGPRPVTIRVVDAAREPCPGGAPPNRLNEVHFTAAPMEDGLLAVTKVAYDHVNGVVRSAKLQVLDIYDQLDATAAPEVDQRVERVVRHELGHFLGLAHSDEAGAVMGAAYDVRRNDGLTSDDVAGICDAYSADQPIGAGCALASWSTVTSNVHHGGARWIALAAGLMALVIRRRRRASILAPVAVALLSLTHATVASAADAPPPNKRAEHVLRRATKPSKQKPLAKPASSDPPVDPVLAQEAAVLLQQAALRQQKEPSLSSSWSAAPRPIVLRAGPVISNVAPAPPSAMTMQPPARAAEAAIDAPPSSRSRDLYVGARYRAYAVPTPVAGMFAKSSQNLLFHSVSMEGEVRYERLAIVPALTFADLSTGDLLLGSKSSDLASSFSYIRSDMKAIAASVGLVWTVPLSPRVSFELGLELGLGVTFGSLIDNWVYETTNGPLSYGGRRFAACKTVNDGFGCRPQDHDSPKPIRVGGHREASILDGGNAPTLLPWVSLPLTGVRVRVTDGIAARFGVGASLTGIWAGVSVSYRVAKADPR